MKGMEASKGWITDMAEELLRKEAMIGAKKLQKYLPKQFTL
jgi:hypothetical protein